MIIHSHLDIPGTVRSRLFSNWYFWRNTQYGVWPINEKHFREQCRQAQVDGVRFVVLNIESWPIDLRKAPDNEVDETLQRFIEIVEIAKAEAPLVEFAWYSMFPIRTIHHHYATPEWEQANHRLLRTRAVSGRYVAADPWHACGIVCPSLYCFETQLGFDNWAEAASNDLAMARKGATEVRPFVWPFFHANGGQTPPDTLLPLDWWGSMFKWCHEQKLHPIVWMPHYQLRLLKDTNAPHLDVIQMWGGGEF